MHELMEVYIKGMSERSELIPCHIKSKTVAVNINI